jgi:hypothetical protein
VEKNTYTGARSIDHKSIDEREKKKKKEKEKEKKIKEPIYIVIG